MYCTYMYTWMAARTWGTLAHADLPPPALPHTYTVQGRPSRTWSLGTTRVAVSRCISQSMRSPVVRRLFPIQGRPPGHWSRCWTHGTHVRPSIPQLRCRGAACEGGADASPRVDWSALLATHRTLISASTDVLVARASCCCCSWCCMLPSARSSTSGVHVTTIQEAWLAARGRLPFARPLEFGLEI